MLQEAVVNLQRQKKERQIESYKMVDMMRCNEFARDEVAVWRKFICFRTMGEKEREWILGQVQARMGLGKEEMTPDRKKLIQNQIVETMRSIRSTSCGNMKETLLCEHRGFPFWLFWS